MMLKDKVALVTGAGRGIGRAIAERFAREGASVAVVSRTPSTIDEVVSGIEAAGGVAFGISCDVADGAQINNAVKAAVDRFGALHIVVNNAQGFGTAEKPMSSTVYVGCEDTDDAEWDYLIRTGPTASMRFMRAAFPHMKAAGWGKVINFASNSGQVGFEGNTSYNSAKEAIRALSRTAAREWGQHGINVNIINPTVETRAFDSWKKARPEFVNALKDTIPMRRLGEPADVAKLAAFLASHESDYMTGGTFMCDGGLTTLP